ncbi:tetratricopeptide repeat protein [Gimesia sp.]|uniref:tetratricopeptide repeat protein n=1 Tax=Gimesia sp. TaxID=2024833 RepID=UPI003A8EABB0
MMIKTLILGMILFAGFTFVGCSDQVPPPEMDGEPVSEQETRPDPGKTNAEKVQEASAPPVPQWETPEEWVALMKRTLNIPQQREQDSSGSVKQTKIRRPLTVGSVLGMQNTENDSEKAVFPQYHKLVANGSIERLNAALNEAELISDAGEQAEAYCGIAWALMDEEVFQRSKPYLVQGEKLLPQVQDPLKHEELLNLYSKAYARAGDKDKAVEVAQQIANLDLRKKTMISIPGQIAKTGNVEQALSFVETIQDRKSQSEALQQITFVLAKSNACNQALTIAKQITDEETRLKALEGIALELAKARRGSQALKVVQQIKFLHRRPWFLRSLAKLLIETGHSEQALEIAPLIDGSREQSTYLMEVAIALAETGKSKQAQEVVQQIPVLDSRRIAVAKVASGLFNAGQVHDALELTQQIAYDNQKVRLLYGIASALHSKGGDKQKLIALKEAVAASVRLGETPSFATAIRVLSEESRRSEQGTSTQLKSAFTPEEQQLAEELLQAAQQKQ